MPHYSFFLENFNVDEFAKRLWGDIFFNPEKRSFKRKPIDSLNQRTFVHFILEPLYKLYGQVLSEDTTVLKSTLASLGIVLKPAQYKVDVKTLLKLVCLRFFGDSSGLVDMVVSKIPSPIQNAVNKTENIYTGDMNSPQAVAMKSCDPDGPLMVHIVKLYNSDDMSAFSAFGRVMSGTISQGQIVRVLGEKYTPDDEEDMSIQNVNEISFFESR